MWIEIWICWIFDNEEELWIIWRIILILIWLYILSNQTVAKVRTYILIIWCDFKNSMYSCPSFVHLFIICFCFAVFISLLLSLFMFNSAGFVGDSLNRNMFVSLFCSLKRVPGEVRKWRPFGADRGFTFLEYNLTIAYHRTNLLVRHGR